MYNYDEAFLHDIGGENFGVVPHTNHTDDLHVRVVQAVLNNCYI